jgi:hypothetical protein
VYGIVGGRLSVCTVYVGKTTRHLNGTPPVVRHHWQRATIWRLRADILLSTLRIRLTGKCPALRFAQGVYRYFCGKH